MKKVMLVLTLSTLTLVASPLSANPTNHVLSSPNGKANPLALAQCPTDTTKTRVKKAPSTSSPWTFKLIPRLQLQESLPQQAPIEPTHVDPLVVFGEVKPSKDDSNTKTSPEVLTTSPAKITAMGTATMSIALILKLMGGERGCIPASGTINAQQDAQQETRESSKTTQTDQDHKPGEVVSCFGCGQGPIDSNDVTDDGFDERYRDDSTDAPAASSATVFRGRSMTSSTPTTGNRFSTRRTSSSPQLATPRTRVKLGTSRIGKR